MTKEQFEVLVGKLEQQARHNPGWYKSKVMLLSFLGNAYIGVLLVVIATLFAVLVASIMVLKALAAKLIIIVGVFLWMILKALWVKVELPSGIPINARQAPELFAMIRDLRRELRAPRFHHVLVTNDFNAGVVQSPRLGIFGWPRNYLIIGLPLMKSLSVEQFKVVLAHEFGHLAKGHGRMSNWIYRQRLRWSRLLDVLDARKSAGSFLFKPFLNWFAPYFNACSFPLARANEYQADATSVRLTSARAVAEALTGVNVAGSYFSERYWPQIYKQADDVPRPAFTPFSKMGYGVAKELDGASANAWLDRAMAAQTDSADTHPALSDRLKAIGEPPRLALPGLDGAADHLLGSGREAIAERLDTQWRDGVLASWEQRHREIQEGRRRLAELDAKYAGDEELPLSEAYERARLTESIGGDAENAFAQFRALYLRAPDDAVACLGYGGRLLARDDAQGCALVEKAMELDDTCIASGSELLRDYHWRNGRKDEAHAWHERLIERIQLENAAAKERNEVTLKDKFERHGLSDAALAQLREQLKNIPGLRKAYLARKRVDHLPHRPFYVFGFSVTGFMQLHSNTRVSEALQLIKETVRFSGETMIISIDGENYRFGRKFSRRRGDRIR